MRTKHLYLALCLLGTALPCWQFLPFLRDHGLNLRLFAEQLFANPVSGFFGMDVLVSSVVLWVLVAVEGRRAGMQHLWVPTVANFAVGVSLGLPLFLYLREVRMEQSAGEKIMTASQRNSGNKSKKTINPSRPPRI